MRVLKEPYEAVALMPMVYGTLRDNRSIDPPKLVGPMVAADPGLRSKSIPAMNWLVKNAHEWCVGLLVSLNGMPSNNMVYWPSAKPRKEGSLPPRPTPLGLTLNVPGALLSSSV